ncbi:unnamed protein product [Rotaria sordida]|uniref:ADP ribosyltransferase domain-containing protein n=1 Tax=Rotaria sordida TaxID=392033 RepID=A0A819ATL9_9BILA|nr:unnamed protein product [Rotaria sordida]CAF3785145.1 unnamed protein product [Rotaria sordida]
MGNESSVQSIEDRQSVKTNDDENKESITLIWFDPNIGSNEDPKKLKQTLGHINDYVVFASDREQCITFIESIHQEKIFLITSRSKALQILPRVSSLHQIDSIFIFSMEKNQDDYLLNNYSKIIGIYINLDDLCKVIKEQINLVDRQIQTFSFFDQYQKLTEDLSKDSTEFIWFQLFNYILSTLSRDQQAKQQMIQICKDYYHGNRKEIELIHQFEQNYRSKDALLWYSKRSFIYKLINKALRTKDIHLLYKLRFFIRDLSENLQREHEKILFSNETTLNVYRGIKLSKEEFDKIKQNQGKLISTNGYFSTSRLKSFASNFAQKSTKRTADLVSILFHIQYDIKHIDKNITFADIDQYSDYPYEQEVLFDLNTCFQIESIQENESIQIIKMNLSNEGQKITKDYIELIQKETEGMNISIIFGRLLNDLGEYDKSQKYFQQFLCNNTQNEDHAWIEFNPGEALYCKGEWNLAREYYDYAYDRMMKSKPARIKGSARVLNNIGTILDNEGKYDEALDYYQRSLKIIEEFYPFCHADIVTSLENIGLIFCKQEKYDQALDYHKQALEIQQKIYSIIHINVATSLNYIGIILRNQRKYDEALDYNQQALKIQQILYPFGHMKMAYSFNNIGTILYDQEKYNEAFDYFQQALKIQEKFYPSSHETIATNLNNIGMVLRNQRKYDEALNYHQKVLAILQKLYPIGHEDIVHTLNNIGEIQYCKEKYDVALYYYRQALKIQENLYPTGHIDLVGNFSKIGVILNIQGKYAEALDYHRRAFKLQQEFYPLGHVNMAYNFKHIGDIHFDQEKYDIALYYYQQALKIREKFYPSVHVDIASSLNNIGLCYENQNKQNLALEYYQRALTIYEKFLPVHDSNRHRTEHRILELTRKA